MEGTFDETIFDQKYLFDYENRVITSLRTGNPVKIIEKYNSYSLIDNNKIRHIFGANKIFGLTACPPPEEGEEFLTLDEYPDYGFYYNRTTGKLRVFSRNRTGKFLKPHGQRGIREEYKGKQVGRWVAMLYPNEIVHPSPEDTSYTIDHIDRDPTNNKIENLRWATKNEQCLNQSRQVKNRYIQISPSGLFSVVITKNKVTYRKCFGKNRLDEAIKWRDEKLKELGIKIDHIDKVGERGKSNKLIEIEKHIEKIKNEKHRNIRISNNNLCVMIERGTRNNRKLYQKYFPRNKLDEAIAWRDEVEKSIRALKE